MKISIKAGIALVAFGFALLSISPAKQAKEPTTASDPHPVVLQSHGGNNTL